ncbi:MAG: TerB family tellurite resistance protein, partial [Bacteroidota bacterium]|nr:TerB family tellurite resistance protein [Bacteroidota bacterium]
MKKCKRILWMVGLGLILSVTEGRAQSIGQLITQLSYDIQKLKELKKILQEMYQSYEIIDKGYTDIRNIVEGNFDLHKAFLDALLAISPTVAGYTRIGEIINTEITLVKEYQAGIGRFRADGHFSAAELDYMSSLYGVLLDRGERA